MDQSISAAGGSDGAAAPPPLAGVKRGRPPAVSDGDDGDAAAAASAATAAAAAVPIATTPIAAAAAAAAAADPTPTTPAATPTIPTPQRVVAPYRHVFKSGAKGRWVGRALLEVFTTEFDSHDAAYFAAAVAAGAIRVNNRVVAPTTVLRDCDVVTHTLHRHEPAVPGGPLTVVYDASPRGGVVVVDKPGGIPVHPSGPFNKNCLVALLEAEAGLARLHPLHRLDRLTSGIVLLGHTARPGGAPSCGGAGSDAALTPAGLLALIAAGSVTKVYLARVRGAFPRYGGAAVPPAADVDVAAIVRDVCTAAAVLESPPPGAPTTPPPPPACTRLPPDAYLAGFNPTDTRTAGSDAAAGSGGGGSGGSSESSSGGGGGSSSSGGGGGGDDAAAAPDTAGGWAVDWVTLPGAATDGDEGRAARQWLRVNVGVLTTSHKGARHGTAADAAAGDAASKVRCSAIL